MIKEIVSLRRKGMSFRKIAKELNSTVGKVHYQWLKYSNTKTEIENPPIKNKDYFLNCSDQLEHFLISDLTVENKLFSQWYIAKWQKEMVSFYFNQVANQKIMIFRVYDVTDIYFNGANAHSYYEFQLPEGRTNWTVKGLKKDRTYLTEIGFNVNQHYFPILRSNAVHIHKDEDKINYHNQLQMITIENNDETQPNWIDQVSTYSYYENINEVKS
ncbi:DUF4912 domain-containing protein [Neobacillus sp. D3-1R]|uniref:DUF4912 domain-containing protein n=1 Tax=Neobacillus sp. D3-1R TaxID=3445778 RepID=UPI003FA084E8